MRKYFFFAAIVLCTGCYYDNQEEIHPTLGTICDTTTLLITYSSDIVPILSSSCGITDNACHNTNSSDSQIGLETYAGVTVQINNNNKFLKSITHDPNAIAMPQSGGKLDECSIMKIESWIDHGFLNN